MRRAVATVSTVVLAATLGLTGASSVPSVAAEPATVLTGKVVDEHGVAVNSLDVYAGWDMTTTAADGSFRVDVEPGPVTLQFWDNHFQQFGFDHEVTANAVSGTTKDLGAIVLRSVANPSRSAVSIDTSRRRAVRSAYRVVKHAVRNEKDLTPRGCRVAKTPAATQRRTISAINVIRRMSGLDPVRSDPKLAKRAQKAAIIQYYQGYLSHFPSPSARCATKKGVAASGKSNLALGYEGADVVLAYMTDDGANNTAVGHRRWIQNPYAETMGTGQVGRANALYVLGPSSPDNPTPPSISWPTPGFFPGELEPAGRWSYSTTRQYDVSFEHAKVRATVAGRKLKLSQYPPEIGYGYQSTIVWQFRRPVAVPRHGSEAVQVTITGITQRGIALAPVRYIVRLFRA